MLGASVGMAFVEEGGQYRFRGFEPGRYRILVHLAGYRSAERDCALKKGLNGGIDFALEKKVSGLVRLTVVDGAGVPLEGVDFSVSAGDVSSTLLVTQGDDLGVYETRELEVGTHEVVAGLAGYEYARATVKVGKDRTVDVRMVLRKKP
jgi:hypothetical protein